MSEDASFTLDQIVERARLVNIDSAKIENGEVWFCENFETGENEDVNDGASELSIDIQDALRDAGLIAEDMDSDNDSVWGKIRQRNAQDI